MPLAGRLSDLSGRRKFIAAGLFIYSLVSFCFIFAESPAGLTLLRFGQGLAAAMILPIAQAYAGELSPARREGKYMGIFSLALFAGFGAGPVLGGLLKDLCGINCSIYALSRITLAAGIVAVLLLPERRQKHRQPALPGAAFFTALASSLVRRVLVLRVSVALCRGAVIAFVPILAHKCLGLSCTQIGIIISAHVIITAILQAPFGMLADRVNRKKLIILGGSAAAVLLLFIPQVRSFAQLLALSLCYGVFGALLLPAATAIMVTEGRRYGMGGAMSLFNMSMDFGLAIGPLIGGVLSDALGLSYVFYLCSIIGFLGVCYFGLQSQQNAP